LEVIVLFTSRTLLLDAGLPPVQTVPASVWILLLLMAAAPLAFGLLYSVFLVTSAKRVLRRQRSAQSASD